MIIDFTVRNYCSVEDTVRLTFEPVSGFKELSDIYFLEPMSGVRLLKLGVILGANASGKTTLLRSMQVLRELVCNPLSNKTRKLQFYVPYWFGTHNGEPTDLSIRFIADDRQYHYRVSFNSLCVVEERLRVYENRWLLLYSRQTVEETQTVKIKPGQITAKYKEVFKDLERATLWNNTVLGGFLKISADIPDFQNVIEWFGHYLYPLIEPSSNLYSFVSHQIEKNIISKERLISYLHGGDLMIEDFALKQESWESIDEKIRMRIVESNPDMSLEEIKERFPARHVIFTHSNGVELTQLDYTDESLGTQRFYQLCGVLDMLISQRCMFFIDEVENSIHPDLLEYFLKTFLVNSRQSQLLVSTHYREWLMQEDFVRPDSVWFTEKHSDGSTHLYSLSDFRDVNSFNRSFSYYDAYRRGMLGARPSYRGFYVSNINNGIQK